MPLVGWMGGKRRYASGILAALGVERHQVESALLVDAGSWGWVWPVVLDPETGPMVAEVLDSWRGEDPVALWDRLAAQDLPDDEVQAVAHWLWMQGRSASNVPVWWDGTWSKGLKPGRIEAQSPSQRGAWRMGEKNAKGERVAACQSGTGAGLANGLRDPGTVARRIRAAVAMGQSAPPICVRRASVLDIAPPADASDHVVYIDPPYAGCTAYSAKLSRDDVLEVGRRWAAAGACVAISEAVPLDLEGWRHVEITSLGRCGAKPEWLTMSHEPAWRPAEQLELLELLEAV